MTNSMNKAPAHLTGHGHKWCEYCQKTDHNDDECWSTRMVSPAEEMARRFPSRTPALNRIFYRTTYADFQARVKRLQVNSSKKPS